MNVKYSKIDCSHLPYVVLFSATLVICIAPPLSCQERAASEDVVVQRIASAYYAKKYGVDLKEAERRLTIQDRAAGIDDAIAKLLGDQFAGIWYDHADRGTLKIGMTAAAMKHADEVRRLAISHGVAADMDLVTVAFTLAELEQKQDLIRSDIEDMIDAGHASTSYDTKLNNVVVTALAKLPSGEETRVKNLAEMSGVTVRRIDVPTLIGKLDACTVKGCDPPLRGGVVIRQDGGNQAGESNTFATCTAGFIARDRTNPNSLWVITGGHCIFFAGRPWEASAEPSERWGLIGRSAFYDFDDKPGRDYGKISIDTNSVWAKKSACPAVVVMDSEWTIHSTNYDPKYAIRATSLSSYGQVLCRTGAFSGSECGVVVALGVDVANEWFDGKTHTFHHMGATDMCGSAHRDSGGPLFKDHAAYGLHHGHIKFLQTFPNPIQECWQYYQGIRGAEAALNLNVMLAPASGDPCPQK